MPEHKVTRIILSSFLTIFLIVFVTAFSLSFLLNQEKINEYATVNLAPKIDSALEQLFKKSGTIEQIETEHRSVLNECDSGEVAYIGEPVTGLRINCDEIRNTDLDEFTSVAKAKLKMRSRESIIQLIQIPPEIFQITKRSWIIFGMLSLIFIGAMILVAQEIPWINLGVIFVIVGLPFVMVLVSKPFLTDYVNSVITERFSGNMFVGNAPLTTLKGAISEMIILITNILATGYGITFALGIVFLTVGIIKNKKLKKQNGKSRMPNLKNK